MEFEFGDFRDGEIKYARVELDGFTVEFQGWNSHLQPYDRVLVIRDGQIVLSKTVKIDNVGRVRLSEVERLIEETKETLKK